MSISRSITYRWLMISLFLCSALLSHTENPPRPKDLKKVFSKKGEYFGQFSWYTCNADSGYYLTDTVRFYTGEYRYMKSHCCKEISWTFHNKHTFQLTEHRHCQEPPLSTVNTEDGRLKLILKKKKDYLILSVKRKRELLYSFRVIDFKTTGVDSRRNENYELTLLRLPLK